MRVKCKFMRKKNAHLQDSKHANLHYKHENVWIENVVKLKRL